MYPSLLEKLIECFKMLPSVGQKTAERYAMRILELPKEEVVEFGKQLIDVKENIKECQTCGNLTEGKICSICSDELRDKNTICVVQQPKDVMAIEKIGQYRGVYHVLKGAISPIKGILPEDLNIDSLINRINPNTKEVILATNSTTEGETTALYITKLLSDYPSIVVSRLASGLPMGGNLDYADEITLARALIGRIKI